MLPTLRAKGQSRIVTDSVSVPSQTYALDPLPRFHGDVLGERDSMISSGANAAPEAHLGTHAARPTDSRSRFNKCTVMSDAITSPSGSHGRPPLRSHTSGSDEDYKNNDDSDSADSRFRAVAIFQPRAREQEQELARASRAAGSSWPITTWAADRSEQEEKGQPHSVDTAVVTREFPSSSSSPSSLANPLRGGSVNRLPLIRPCPEDKIVSNSAEPLAEWAERAPHRLQPPSNITPARFQKRDARMGQEQPHDRQHIRGTLPTELGATTAATAAAAPSASIENPNALAVRNLFARHCGKATTVGNEDDDTVTESSEPSDTEERIHSDENGIRSLQGNRRSMETGEQASQPTEVPVLDLPKNAQALVAALVARRVKNHPRRGATGFAGAAIPAKPQLRGPSATRDPLVSGQEELCVKGYAQGFPELESGNERSPFGSWIHQSQQCAAHSARRRLLYDEQYQRNLIAHTADTQFPVPWLRENNLIRAAGSSGFHTTGSALTPTCVLHEVAFRSDEAIADAAAAALEAYIARRRVAVEEVAGAEEQRQLCGDANGLQSGSSRVCSPRSRRAGVGKEGGAAEAARARIEEDERLQVLREAGREKGAAFESAHRFHDTLRARLALVEEEKTARLNLLGRFASCDWPVPCRCLRWDQEVLETSAIPLEPRLDTACVYVSVVLSGCAGLHSEHLATHAWELARLRERQEVEIIALCVRERLRQDEDRAFARLTTFHAYCMTVAVRAGVSKVPERFASMSALAAFEKALAREPAALSLMYEREVHTTEARRGTAQSNSFELPSPRRASSPAENPRTVCTLDGISALTRDTLTANAASKAGVSPNAARKRAAPHIVVLGPRDSPFCSLLTFLDLFIVQAAALQTRQGLAEEEACERGAIQRHVRRMEAAAALESVELATRRAELEGPEARIRAEHHSACDADAACAAEQTRKRLMREQELRRITAALQEVEATAEREHAACILGWHEAFRSLHAEEASARRWLLLRERQNREGCGPETVARLVLARDLNLTVRKELAARQRCLGTESLERVLMERSIRIAAKAFECGECIAAEEDAAYARLSLTVHEEGLNRLCLQRTYVKEQFSLFGHRIHLDDDNDDGGGPDRINVGHEEGHCKKEHRSSHDAHKGDDKAWEGSFACESPVSPFLAHSTTSGTVAPTESSAGDGGSGVRGRPRIEMLSRGCLSAMVVLGNGPTHPLEAAVAMQRLAMYNLHDFLPENELLELFSG